MKTHLAIAAVLAAFFAPLACADSSCRPVVIPRQVEAGTGELVLADLLPASACPALRAAARQVRLGRVPLPGSPRVLTSVQVRALLEKLRAEKLSDKFWTVPERITIRSPGEREPRTAAGERTPGQQIPGRVLQGPILAAAVAAAVVRPGQTVILVWDQYGIRVQVPALCLDRGAPGSEVRARILPSGAVMRATVENAGSVRAIS